MAESLVVMSVSLFERVSGDKPETTNLQVPTKYTAQEKTARGICRFLIFFVLHLRKCSES
jgi:hypothetical protein